MKFVALILLSASLAACSTSSKKPDPQPEGATTPEGRAGFMGLEEGPLEADWETWTPSRTPAAPENPGRSFDVWRLTDRADQESVWVALFALLNGTRTYLPERFEPTFRELLTLLDPSHPDVVTEYVFVVGESSEGVLVRTFRPLPVGGTPGVVLELLRTTGQGDNPSRIRLHLHSGFEEAPSVSIDLARPDSIAWKPANRDTGWHIISNPELATELSVVRDIVSGTIWKPILGNAYVEPPFEVMRESDREHPPDFPPGHGVPPDLRPIDRVWSDTVFPPRVDL